MAKNFETDLCNSESPIAIDLSPSSTSLLIAFGGIYGALGMAPFEFFNLTKNYEVNKIYIRDLYQCWYHRGLPELAKDIEDIALFLKKAVNKTGVERVVLVGNSMGGYAAILFGTLIDANEVHAFSPQTFIDKKNCEFYRDNRWHNELDKVYLFSESKFYDLKSVVDGYVGRCTFHIHYSTLDRLDKLHAEHLGKFAVTSLHPYNIGGHAVIKHLKESGMLESIICGAISQSV
jgi:hypothetical protein